jgi:hypothetical protein
MAPVCAAAGEKLHSDLGGAIRKNGLMIAEKLQA